MGNDTVVSRRTLLKAGGSAALLPLLHSPAARALARANAVNVRHYYKSDWPDAFKRAFEAANTVEIPPDVVCDNLNSAIVMPAGAILRVKGRMTGNGNGRFVPGDRCQVIGEKGGIIHNVILDIRGSHCVYNNWK